MYTTTTIKHHRTNFLDSLAHESGRCYSKVVSLVRKTHAKKGFWLSKNDVQKYLRLRGYGLHSQSVQACADSYFDALDAYFQVRKVNADAKPPKRTPKHFKVRWKSTAIRLVSHDGENTIIYNGRFVRSLIQYRNKVNARFQANMDRCEKRSKRWYQLLKAKRKTLDKINAQLKDAEHKITSRFISDCEKAKADTIVIGDLNGIRDRAKFGKKSNQKIHQWAFSRIAQKICYKAELAGIHVIFVSEAYTSQTCPKCANRKKPTNRNYHCKHCGFKYHRDGVGAINLWSKVSGYLLYPVVGELAAPLGVKFHWHLSRSG